jgi:hypothetical protein
MKLKLKPIGKREQYSLHQCAVTRCHEISIVIISTEIKPYSLCQKHWDKRCSKE